MERLTKTSTYTGYLPLLNKNNLSGSKNMNEEIKKIIDNLEETMQEIDNELKNANYNSKKMYLAGKYSAIQDCIILIKKELKNG